MWAGNTTTTNTAHDDGGQASSVSVSSDFAAVSYDEGEFSGRCCLRWVTRGPLTATFGRWLLLPSLRLHLNLIGIFSGGPFAAPTSNLRMTKSFELAQLACADQRVLRVFGCYPQWARGGIGRHAGLRILWSNPCRFNSCRAHHFNSGLWLFLRFHDKFLRVSGFAWQISERR